LLGVKEIQRTVRSSAAIKRITPDSATAQTFPCAFACVDS
jgi:hypothetical protein